MVRGVGPEEEANARGAAGHVIEDKRQAAGDYREFFESFVDRSADLMTLVDREARLLYVNQAARRIFGLEPAECIGLSAFEFVHAEDRARTREAFQSWVEQGSEESLQFENRQVGRQGQCHPMLWTVNPVHDEAGELTGFASCARDIRDRIRAEELEREAREELRLITDALPVFIAYVDAGERYRFSNEASSEWFGEPSEAIAGRTVREVVGEAAYAALQPHVAQALRGERVVFERPLCFRRGSEMHVRGVYVPRRSEEGAVLGYYSLEEDVTVRSRMERERFASEARLRAVLASVLDPTLTIDAFGTIQTASESVHAVFGYRPGELIGRNIKLLMPEPHRSQHDSYLARHRRTGEENILGKTREFDVVRKDGEVITCELSVSAVDPQGDGERLFTGSFRDITARKRAEEALQESERRFRAIFDQEFQLVGLLDREGTIVEANLAALGTSGVERAAVVGRPFWEACWWSISPEMMDRLREAVAQAAGGEFVRFEIAYVDRAGKRRCVDFSIKPVRDEDGSVALLLPEGRDITELKRAQNAETAMLRSLAAIGESAAVLVHEIKSPITGIRLALRAVAEQIGEDHQQILDELVGRMQRLQKMMQRTLSFASPLELHRRTFAASDLLQRTAAQTRLVLIKGGVQLETALEPGELQVLGDPELLEEVLVNLVQNAAEVLEQGGNVRLTGERRAEGEVVFAVEDDGPGISSSVRATLFMPFVTTKQKGTGLGLAICRKIVEAHGGEIEVRAGSRGGARFEVRLPPGPPGD